MWAARFRYWRQRRVALALAVVSGVLFAASFCGYDHDALAWFCLVPTICALDNPKLGTRGALGISWLMGFVAHLGVYTWLVGMLEDFGYLPLPWAIVGYVFICWVQSVLFAGFGLGTYVLRHRFGVPMGLAAPVVMVLCEWLTPALFPSYMANTQYQQPWVIQGCGLWGVLGLSYMLVWSSTAIYQTLAWARTRTGPRPTWSVGTWAVCLLAMLLYGQQTTARLDKTIADTERKVTVGLVQTNMGIYEKTDNPAEGQRRHLDQSLEVEAAGAQLVVWAESGYYYALDANTTNVKRQVMGRLQTPLLFGALRNQPGPEGVEQYNSAFLADGHGELLSSYDKTHLLAFGEFLPFGETLPWLYSLSPQTSRFWRGRHLQPLQFEDIRIGTLICYEDILPSFVRQVMDSSPDLLVNLTNDAWFGNSREPRIHLALAVFRAVEHHRYLVRSTNTGISAIIDPAGRILQETPVFTRANLVGDIKPMTGTTLYQTLGDWPGWASLAAVLMWTRASWLGLLRRRLTRSSNAAAV